LKRNLRSTKLEETEVQLQFALEEGKRLRQMLDVALAQQKFEKVRTEQDFQNEAELEGLRELVKQLR